MPWDTANMWAAEEPRPGLQGPACCSLSLGRPPPRRPRSLSTPHHSLLSAPSPSRLPLAKWSLEGWTLHPASSTHPSLGSLPKHPFLMMSWLTPRTTSHLREHVFAAPSLHLWGDNFISVRIMIGVMFILASQVSSWNSWLDSSTYHRAWHRVQLLLF